MGGYVYRKTATWTELRVHGVSGTPPASMLGHPQVERVSGDADSGFYRRWWPAKSLADDDGDHVLEAYSWGGLTAGGRQRALWLLLVPFLLVNVAYFARPAYDPEDHRVKDAILGAAQRLFALTITATLVLAVVNVSMDFAGWQCVRPGRPCTDDVPWLAFLNWHWLATPGRRLAVTALAPLALIGLLWWLANKTWRATEAVKIKAEEPEPRQRTPLENRRMWNSAGPVRMLRSVHITAALALVGVFALVPFARSTTLAMVLLIAALILLAISVVLVCRPDMSKRPDPTDDAEPAWPKWLPWVAVFVDVAALLLLSLPAAGLHADPTPGEPRTTLPWLSMAVQVAIAAQAILLAITVAALAMLRSGAQGSVDVAKGSDGNALQAPSAWSGFGTAVLMLFGSALSGAYAAALVLTAAHVLGKPTENDARVQPFVTPMPYFWAAALAFLIAVAAIVPVIVGWRDIRGAIVDPVRPEVTRTYHLSIEADQEAQQRVQSIATAWARAGMDRPGQRLLGWFVLFMAATIAAAGVLYVIDQEWVIEHVPWMVNIGDWLVCLFAVGLLYVGRKAYTDPNVRRVVGVIWDLGTFWPRATHPLAPPCYAERAVPDLIDRIAFLGDASRGTRVVLSCHSQGSIIGTAVVMQLTYEQSAQVALLTYGCPLRRLYSRLFPAYFGLDALQDAGAFLIRDRKAAYGPSDRRQWPWRNLYRSSDPIGGPVFVDDPVAVPGCVDHDDIDEGLIDPVFAKAPGDGRYPQTFGHSGYPDDATYAAAVERIKNLRVTAAARVRASAGDEQP
ncbi:MAG TPA: hypothetical protein VGP91_16975 [Actinoplanes sp.]|nr:hypothetical protein [Actinoplanes sp.]